MVHWEYLLYLTVQKRRKKTTKVGISLDIGTACKLDRKCNGKLGEFKHVLETELVRDVNTATDQGQKTSCIEKFNSLLIGAVNKFVCVFKRTLCHDVILMREK
jgi:hypothetical protein